MRDAKIRPHHTCRKNDEKRKKRGEIIRKGGRGCRSIQFLPASVDIAFLLCLWSIRRRFFRLSFCPSFPSSAPFWSRPWENRSKRSNPLPRCPIPPPRRKWRLEGETVCQCGLGGNGRPRSNLHIAVGGLDSLIRYYLLCFYLRQHVMRQGIIDNSNTLDPIVSSCSVKFRVWDSPKVL